MPARKRTKRELCIKFEEFLLLKRISPPITGWSSQSVIGDAAAHICRGREDDKLRGKLYDIWNNNRFKIQERHARNMMLVFPNLELPAPPPSPTPATTQELECEVHPDPDAIGADTQMIDAPKSDPAASLMTFKLPVFQECSSLYNPILDVMDHVILHKPPHSSDKKIKLSHAEVSICAGCSKRFGRDVTALKCSCCLMWYHKKKFCTKYDEESEKDARKGLWVCEQCMD